ncbi:MAG TPA: hypothetical protein VMV59_08180 [Candidatus Dormibacteraeota bacterium]|nr:hypothetical protein [Candidatus Dormibacteraeota bacterium]
MKEKLQGEFSVDVLRAADELDHALIRARHRRQPFVLIEVGAHVVGVIVRPNMLDPKFYRKKPKEKNENASI